METAPFDVVLLPTFPQVERYRKQHAADLGPTALQGSGGFAGPAFGQTVTTPGAWLADLWELYGDGRTLADALSRAMVVQAALRGQTKEEGLSSDAAAALITPGYASTIESVVKDGAGLPEVRQALDTADAGRMPQGFSDPEAFALRVCARYFRLLDGFGLIEAGSALDALAHSEPAVFHRPVRVLVADAGPLSWQWRHFFDVCPSVEITVRSAGGQQGVGPAPEGVGLSFAFPAGDYATPGLLADVVEQAAPAGQVIVACKDPALRFAQVSNRLSDRGISSGCKARIAFADTDFGRAFAALSQVLSGGSADAAPLTDVLLSAYSGCMPAQAFQVDAGIRGDRTADVLQVAEQLGQASQLLSSLAHLVEGTDVRDAVDVLVARVEALRGRSAAWRAQERTAVETAGAAFGMGNALGVSAQDCAAVLNRLGMNVSFGTCETQPQVVFATQGVASGIDPAQVATVVVCDLTSQAYPVADKDDAASTLFEKMGLVPVDTALAKARRTFHILEHMPSSRLVLERPLHDAEAAETYPCAVLEEFVDAYREDPSATDDIDNPYRLPLALQQSMVQRGEELLFANAARQEPHAAQAGGSVCVPPFDFLEQPARSRVEVPRLAPDGQPLGWHCPSPSAVEKYLQCPYRWFAERRLNPQALDEGFDARCRGNFCHAVLKGFYEQFKVSESYAGVGYPKVCAESLSRAKETMERVFQHQAALQPTLEAGGGRLIAVSQLERRDMESLLQQLQAYLEFEANFLPAFHPLYLEYEIDLAHAVDYGSGKLIGRIDRIDVDDAGRAVIIDYKGSITDEYDIAEKTVSHMGMVQTRMYATAVERLLGLPVVGALYVSYAKGNRVAGSFDARVLDVASLQTAKEGACDCAVETKPPSAEEEEPGARLLQNLSFADMLQATEEACAHAIDQLASGRIDAAPASPEACKNCIAQNCPERRDN